MVEQRTFNPLVQGSSPWRPTRQCGCGLRPPGGGEQTAPVVPVVMGGSAWEAASWTSRSGTAASSAAVNACRSHRAEPAGDGGPGPAAGFQIAGEELDAGSAALEERQLVLPPEGGYSPPGTWSLASS